MTKGSPSRAERIAASLRDAASTLSGTVSTRGSGVAEVAPPVQQAGRGSLLADAISAVAEKMRQAVDGGRVAAFVPSPSLPSPSLPEVQEASPAEVSAALDRMASVRKNRRGRRRDAAASKIASLRRESKRDAEEATKEAVRRMTVMKVQETAEELLRLRRARVKPANPEVLLPVAAVAVEDSAVADDLVAFSAPLSVDTSAVADEPVALTAPVAVEEPAVADDLVAMSDVAAVSDPVAPVVPAVADEPVAMSAPVAIPPPEFEVDPALFDLAREEASELTQDLLSASTGMQEGGAEGLSEVQRKLHTLKGLVATIGEMGVRSEIHDLESWLDSVSEKRAIPAHHRAQAASMVASVASSVAGIWAPKQDADRPEPVGADAVPVRQRYVRVSSQEIDRILFEAGDASLAHATLTSLSVRQKTMARELHASTHRLARIQRDIELYAESQIQSRRLQLQETGQLLDPLEMDRFTRLQEYTRSLAESVSDTTDIYRDFQDFTATTSAVLVEQSSALSRIQEGLRTTRLVAADEASPRLSQVAVAAAAETGKKVVFEVVGSHQRIDRGLLDKAIAPLEHIVRNAVAHGIESPADRLALGKPEKGTVTLSVSQRNEKLVVEVSDDGAGIDPQKVGARAVERGLRTPADLPISLSDAVDLICTPGFSTASSVGHLAGRGVGMDVVRSEVLGMGGRFEVESHQGKGMTVRLLLPSTLSSISAVVVEQAGHVLAVPVDMVDDIGRMESPDGVSEVVLPSGDSIPYRSLVDGGQGSGAARHFLVLRDGLRRVALGVDRVSSVDELQLRSLPPVWASVPGVVGGVLLSDERPAFLVDPLRLSSMSGIPAAPVSEQDRHAETVLVVDDSLTVRKMASLFLRQRGMEPALARDGREALEWLASNPLPVAVLLDIEMPGMDGFACLGEIRRNPRTSQLPVAMVTSRTADKHREMAMSLGAWAYFGKPMKASEVSPWLDSLVESKKVLQ